jgi:antitoxin ParD1/3/4
MQTISLPDPLHAAAEQRAAETGFRSADEYIADLLRRDLEGQEADVHLRRALADGGEPAAVAAATLANRKREIEGLLIEGLDSGPAAPMTAEEWQSIRQEVQQRRERRKKP